MCEFEATFEGKCGKKHVCWIYCGLGNQLNVWAAGGEDLSSGNTSTAVRQARALTSIIHNDLGTATQSNGPCEPTVA